MLSPNGAPAYFSVRSTLPPVTLNGSLPRPTLTIVSPIPDSGPEVPAFAWASGHSGTPLSIPETRGGMEPHALHVLLAVFAGDRRRQGGERAGVDVQADHPEDRDGENGSEEPGHGVHCEQRGCSTLWPR